MKQVLILGGGFAGIQTAIELQKSRKFKVTLVSDRDFLYIYPISIWVPVRHAEGEAALGWLNSTILLLSDGVPWFGNR